MFHSVFSIVKKKLPRSAAPAIINAVILAEKKNNFTFKQIKNWSNESICMTRNKGKQSIVLKRQSRRCWWRSRSKRWSCLCQYSAYLLGLFDGFCRQTWITFHLTHRVSDYCLLTNTVLVMEFSHYVLDSRIQIIVTTPRRFMLHTRATEPCFLRAPLYLKSQSLHIHSC